MGRSADQRRFCFLYRGSDRAGLSPIGVTAKVAVFAVTAVWLGGCAVSPFGSTSSLLDARADAGDITGSITPARGDGPSDSDLAFARTAATDVLSRGAKDSSQPWENPGTGARGSVTPLANAYTADGFRCRDFLASYVKGATQNWMQGTGCEAAGGRWEIRDLKPWSRS